MSIFAFLLCHSIGMQGAYIDDDLIFYGGWMVLNGQIPYVDFFTSNSVFGSVVLGGLFRIFGVSWNTFVIHASLFNAAFTVLAFILMRQLGLNRWISLAYAAGLAHTYYTPVGFAHPDKDGFTYLLAALSLQLTCVRSNSARHVILAHLAGVWLMMAALLSKSNPTAIYPLALAMPLLAFSMRNISLAAVGALIGFISVALMVGLVEIIHPGFAADLFYYAIKLPFSVGAARVSQTILPSLTKMAEYARFSSFTLSLAVLIASLAGCLISPRMLADRAGRAKILMPAGLGLAFLIITAFHVSHIAQPQSSHVTLVILIIATGHASLLHCIGMEMGGQRARLLLGVVLASYVLIDAREYHRIVNRPRLAYDDAFLEAGSIMPPNTSGLRGYEGVRWIPRRNDENNYLGSRRELIASLEAQPGAVVIMGYSPAFYALAGKPPVVPTNLVIVGHSTPPFDSPEELRLAKRFQRNLKAADVKAAVIGKPGEWLTSTAYACKVERKEWVSVVQLCDGAWDDIDFVVKVLRHAGK